MNDTNLLDNIDKDLNNNSNIKSEDNLQSTLKNIMGGSSTQNDIKSAPLTNDIATIETPEVKNVQNNNQNIKDTNSTINTNTKITKEMDKILEQNNFQQNINSSNDKQSSSPQLKSQLSSNINKKSVLDSLNLNSSESGMHSFTKTIYDFMLPIFNFSIIVVLIVFIIIPFSLNYKSSQTQILENTNLISSLQTKNEGLQELSYIKTSFDNYYSSIEKAMPSEQQIPELLTVIDNIANNAGLEVLRLSYSVSQGVVENNNYSNVDVSLSVTGTLGQLLSFYELSENASRIYSINTFRFTYNKQENLYEVSFLIKSPYLSVNSVAVTDTPISFSIEDSNFINLINTLNSLTYYDPNELRLITPVESYNDNSENTIQSDLVGDSIEIIENTENIETSVINENISQPELIE